MKPVVSVVMPTRGRVSFVRRAILSVIDQSFPEFELLILDNTPSKEKEAVRQLATLDSRIIFVNRGEVGLTEARHLGAVLAKGKLLALLDSDDYWAKRRLERHVETWNHNGIGLSWDRWAEANEREFKVFPQPFKGGLIPPPNVAVKLYGWNFIHASSGIVSTHFARTQGFPLRNIMSSDWALFMKAAERQTSYFLTETLSFKDIHAPERVTDVMTQEVEAEISSIRNWFLMNRPRIYGTLYAKRKLSSFVRKARWGRRIVDVLERTRKYRPGPSPMNRSH